MTEAKPLAAWPDGTWQNALSSAQKYDEDDVLASKINEFLLPKDTVYLDGNSLGPMTSQAKSAANAVLEKQWQPDLIGSWNNHDWIGLPQRVGAQIAPLIGASSNSVIACDSISVNLYKLLHIALNINHTRQLILTQKGNFPTDGYIAQGLLAHRPELALAFIDEQNILSHINDDVAVLLLTHVNYKTGYMLDMAKITERAHEHGVIVICDLAHSAGAVELALEEWDVDFAVGCGYKYLNGGPGAPAFIFANPKHHHQLKQPLTGWMGHREPFAFTQDYTPAEGVESLLCGTPNIISMAVLHGALKVFEGIDMRQVREKSLTMTRFFVELVHAHSGLSELHLITDMADIQRGSQISFSHPEAYAICQAWIAEGVVADFRAPDVLRIGITPLYLRYIDLVIAADKLVHVITTKTYLRPEFQTRQTVT